MNVSLIASLQGLHLGAQHDAEAIGNRLGCALEANPQGHLGYGRAQAHWEGEKLGPWNFARSLSGPHLRGQGDPEADQKLLWGCRRFELLEKLIF